MKNRAKYDPVPAMAKGMHTSVEKRWKKLLEYTEECPLNREEWNTDEVGIVSAGAAYQYAREVFGDNASYFKCGMTSPMPIESIRKFAAKVKKLYSPKTGKTYEGLIVLADTGGKYVNYRISIPRERELTQQA